MNCFGYQKWRNISCCIDHFGGTTILVIFYANRLFMSPEIGWRVLSRHQNFQVRVDSTYDTSLPGLLSPPKCYNCFGVDTSLWSRPLMPPHSWWVDGISGQTNILSDPPLRVGHGRRGEPWYSCVCRYDRYRPAPPKKYLWIPRYHTFTSKASLNPATKKICYDT